MDGEDDAVTPRKALWRSASWSGRPSPPAPATNTISGPARPPRAGRPAALPPLQPLSISRRHPPNEWPRPGSDDSGDLPHHLPPLPPTPSSSSYISASDRECSRVAEHVYLGSDAVARDREVLRRHGITHVLNCVGSACPEYYRGELAYKTLWLRDSPAEDITSVLYDAFDYLEEARACSDPPGRVLVHCLRGASRSASLVVAYLMWRLALPFDDALRRVRSARAAADPNLGFAAQLLRCQRRILHALPSSPGSPAALPRAYRMAPHSPYDPLHLVPKAADRFLLDSRGAFLVHAPSSAVFVWVGRDCEPAMADSAAAAAHQVVRYERARGPILTVHEGAETPNFWVALMDPAASADNSGRNPHNTGEAGKRRVELYDLDFEIFRRALKGGVVPPLPISGASSETHLPARESGWSCVRRKFLTSGTKEIEIVAADAVDEVHREPFRSPGSFSGESSTTPSYSSTDSPSTLSTFSPASSSSFDSNKYSPPGSELHKSPPPLPPSHLLSSLHPLHSRMEKGKDISCSSISTQSLAERRGSIAPLVLLPPSDNLESQLTPRDVVRDWYLSASFISEVEEDQETMDFE